MKKSRQREIVSVFKTLGLETQKTREQFQKISELAQPEKTKVALIIYDSETSNSDIKEVSNA